jgi:DNA-binding response OmpR family regulator
MSPGPKGDVLVIEDDKDIALGIRTVLVRAGYQVTDAADGKQGLRAFHAFRPDLVVLDIGLPELDGWAVLERLRDLSDVPVLILTAHSLEGDKVRGLNAGADDFLTKPFGNSELAARVEALLRRSRADSDPAEVYDDGFIQIRFGSHQVLAHGEPVTLTPTEYRLLSAFVRHPGQILTPDQLLDLAWNDPWGTGPERVKFTVMRLRRKLGQHADAPSHTAPSGAAPSGTAPSAPGAAPPGAARGATSHIEAVRGFGYRYVPPAR